MAAAQSLLLLPALSLPISTPRTLTLAPSLLASRRLSLSARAAQRSSRGGVAVVRYSAVEQDVERGEREHRDGGFSPDLKLFVGNLPFSVDSAKLAGLFESAGTVEMVEVIYDKQTGQSRGFGFVTMSSIEEVEAAAQQFNGYELGGRALRVNAGPPPPRHEAPSRGYHTGGGFHTGGGYETGGGRRGGGGGGGGGYSSGNRVYVGNLSWGVDNASLETLFNEQGRVVEAKVVYDRETGRSRGFGFVTYDSADEVKNAISSLDGAELDGRNIRVSVAEERPRRQF